LRKIKYQGGLTKIVSSYFASLNRATFSRELIANPIEFQDRANNRRELRLDIDLVSASSKRDLPEQVFSILSFIRYVGCPTCWTILSDGSHSKEDVEILNRIFPFVKVEQLLFPAKLSPGLLPYQPVLEDYSNKNFLGKRLAVYLNFSISRPTIFLDSDILFYPQASSIRNIFLDSRRPCFLPEGDWGCLDSRYLATHPAQMYQANGGFFIVNESWGNAERAFDFLQSLNGKYEYFSEQTFFHILSRDNEYFPLDPRKFVLTTQDQFDFRLAHDSENIILRHFTGPVRHKMWQTNYKRHLKINAPKSQSDA